LAAKNRKLVAKNHDLQFLELFGAKAQPNELEQALNGDI
jgi:hypothetical protein